MYSDSDEEERESDIKVEEIVSCNKRFYKDGEQHGKDSDGEDDGGIRESGLTIDQLVDSDSDEEHKEVKKDKDGKKMVNYAS